ncbi:hypothetical protein DRJ48_01230 [Candidatus Woesearchaeota archaeon]|nr:glycosyltransferase family 39 protein [Candidatus Woesearchaeota archaeon]RLE43329.1 MAG: hypothetical protein DRJ48_01230 [Candidatus Woesearchaeota archaeon]
MQVNASKWFREHFWILSILGIYLVVKALQMTRFHFIIWDEAVYIAMGKWLYSLGHVGLWEVIRPPLFPLLLGLFWRMGLPVVVFGELAQVLFGAGVIYLTYLLGCKVFNKTSGLIAGFVLSIYPVFFLYSNYLLVGVTSTLFALLSVYLFLNKRWFGAGVLAGLAFLTRFPQLLTLVSLMLVVGCYWLSTKRKAWLKRGIMLGCGFATTVLPFFVFNYFLYRNKTTWFYAMIRPLLLAVSHQSNPFEAVGGNTLALKLYNAFYYFVELFKQNWVFVFFVIGLVLLVIKRGHKKLGVRVLLSYLLVYFIYYSYIINKQIRFANTFLPFVCILIGYGIVELYNAITSLKLVSTYKLFVCVLFILLVGCLLLHAIKIDHGYYHWRYSQPPPIVDDFYMYFAKHPPHGAIVTADPVPAAYVDARFIPAVKDIPTAIKIMNESFRKPDTEYLIFKLSSYPCLEGDKNCFSNRQRLLALVKSNKLVYNKTFFNEPYLIYIINHTLFNQ